MGARGFAALAEQRYPARNLHLFAEERHHANAEMALMKRWGVLEDEIAGQRQPVLSNGWIAMPMKCRCMCWVR